MPRCCGGGKPIDLYDDFARFDDLKTSADGEKKVCLADGTSIMTMRTAQSHKAVLLGNASVGKTCLALAMRDGSAYQFEEQPATIGLDLVMLFDKATKKRLVWVYDTAGQERFNSMTRMFAVGARVVILVFAVGDERSLEACVGWAKTARDAQPLPEPLMVLVGAKADRGEKDSDEWICRTVQAFNTIKPEWAVCVSAKTGYNVDALREKVIELVDRQVDVVARMAKANGCRP